ncbi:uncharacterized protein LOC111388913 [Olea europaea var. sylvestris]|uniref:uncharacterized protein LOC111388913 n=1 Tax=Olea europaea var. sylvestris TaxID=158386 RepID=UPI000C1CE87F|nr:uncharacterized protein LOC111388913 [Olea europaea var. sylvestris]
MTRFRGDCGFPNLHKFLTHFRGVRYHLQDFIGQVRDPENTKESFNLRHTSLRNVIERIFSIFKSRFTIFKTAHPFPYRTQAELVLACIGFHNFLRKEYRFNEFPIELGNENSLSSSINDVEDFIFESQEQERENAKAWRASIATDLWNDVENV